jgi:hypothetical protein
LEGEVGQFAIGEAGLDDQLKHDRLRVGAHAGDGNDEVTVPGPGPRPGPGTVTGTAASRSGSAW